MELFNYEAHQKLWMLLAENIHAAARENYAGNGYYNAYGALERLKKTLLRVSGRQALSGNELG